MFTSITLLVFVVASVSQSNGERVKCQMVPLHTDDGLMGLCCVFIKNMSVNDMRKSLASNGMVHFPEDRHSENKIVTPGTRNKDIVFPGDKQGETWKNVTYKNEDRNDSNGTMIHFPGNEQKNVTSGGEPAVDLRNRNKNDAPETCTDGKKKDLNGNCVDPF